MYVPTPPQQQVTDNVNFLDSVGIIEVSVTGNDSQSNDPDREYVLTIAALDTSNTIIETKIIVLLRW